MYERSLISGLDIRWSARARATYQCTTNANITCNHTVFAHASTPPIHNILEHALPQKLVCVPCQRNTPTHYVRVATNCDTHIRMPIQHTHNVHTIHHLPQAIRMLANAYTPDCGHMRQPSSCSRSAYTHCTCDGMAHVSTLPRLYPAHPAIHSTNTLQRRS